MLQPPDTSDYYLDAHLQMVGLELCALALYPPVGYAHPRRWCRATSRSFVYWKVIAVLLNA
jgi:hypothetical protein